MSGTAAEIKAAEDKQAYEAAILEDYDTEEERAAARAVLESMSGVDLETGLPLDQVAAAAEPSKEDPPSKTDDVGSADAAKAAAAAAKSAEADDKPTDVNAELKAENDDLRRQLATLTVGEELKTFTATKTAELTTKYALDPALTEKVDKVATDYGDEAADPIKEITDKYRDIAGRLAKSEADGEATKIRDERVKQIETGSEVSRAIAGNEHINSWYTEMQAVQGGDGTKSTAKWDIAVAMDKVLMADPAWTGKSVAERFDEVAKRVNSSLGVETGGTPATLDTEQAISAEIARRAAAAKVDDAPETLTDLPGGERITDLTQKLDNMSTAELTDLVEGGSMSIEAADQLIERLEASGAM